MTKTQSRIERVLFGKTPEEQYDILYWLMMEYGKEYSNSRLARIEWLKGDVLDCPSAQSVEDVVPRTSVEYICQKNTVSTNPYEHKYHDKFIQFMDDPEISDFGRWEHSNGFNTALVAVMCDLDKVPSFTPKQPEGEQYDTTESL